MQRPGQHPLLPRVAMAAPVVLFVVVYLVLPRHGFMLDDYGWILHSRVRSFGDVLSLFTESTGFYRPAVGASFALDEWLFGFRPLPYALTNVALALACAGAIGWLARGLGLTRGAAVTVAAVWLLNFHGIRTAVLWTSGRTALLLVVAATAAAGFVVRGRMSAALACLAVALLSKEEAVLVPLVLLTWLPILSRAGMRSRISIPAWVLASAALLAGYALARSISGAMTPTTAPPWYQFVFTWGVVRRNATVYLDEIATFPIAVSLVAIAILGRPRPFDRARATTIAALGSVWMLGAFGLTIWLRTRSDLYACLPAVGTSLVAGEVCAQAWASATPNRQRRALAATLIAAVALSPVYYLRTRHRSAHVTFAARILPELAAATRSVEPDGLVVIDDDLDARRTDEPNLEDAFGALLADAYTLETGRQVRFAIRPPTGLAPPVDPLPPETALHLRLRDGRLEPLRP